MVTILLSLCLNTKYADIYFSYLCHINQTICTANIEIEAHSIEYITMVASTVENIAVCLMTNSQNYNLKYN